jgi:hypothetical protein
MLAALLITCVSQPSNALPFDPRHQFDKRCPVAVALDNSTVQRDPASTSSYLWTPLKQEDTVATCAELCCRDWSCEAFAFIADAPSPPTPAPPYPPGPDSGSCATGLPCCIFKDDIDALAPGAAGVTTGVRAKLPALPPPYPDSDLLGATLEPHFLPGINGDEFPITWGADGSQYSGAGDNQQAGGAESPLSFFKITGGPTTLNCTAPHMTPGSHHEPSPVCSNIPQQGAAVAVSGPEASKAGPAWRDGVPNLKASGVLSVGGVLYWAGTAFC